MMHTEKTVDTFFLRTGHKKKLSTIFFKMCRQLPFKTSPKKLRSAYNNDIFCRNGAPYYEL